MKPIKIIPLKFQPFASARERMVASHAAYYDAVTAALKENGLRLGSKCFKVDALLERVKIPKPVVKIGESE